MRLLLALFANVVLATPTAVPVAPGASDAGPPPSGAAVDGGAPDSGLDHIDPARIDLFRGAMPLPLLYGSFRPAVGEFVDYEVTKKQAKAHMRLAVVGKPSKRTGAGPGTTPAFQLELEYVGVPSTPLIVLWITDEPRPIVDRLAVSMPPYPPVSVPLDLYLDLPELRGKQLTAADARVPSGPFAGEGRRLTYQLADGKQLEVVRSSKVPICGVERLHVGDETWIARASGVGAAPSLKEVPIVVPQIKAIDDMLRNPPSPSEEE